MGAKIIKVGFGKNEELMVIRDVEGFKTDTLNNNWNFTGKDGNVLQVVKIMEDTEIHFFNDPPTEVIPNPEPVISVVYTTLITGSKPGAKFNEAI